MKAQAKPECAHCKRKSARVEGGDGLFYHTVKESNGYDYDRYTYPCAIQTASAMRKAMTRTEKVIDKKIIEVTKQLSSLLETREKVRKCPNVFALEEILRTL
jgi:hypothetical protein